MIELKLGTIESKFADIIWENEPVTSGELVKLAAEKLDWKKSTTFTVLKRLQEKGIFQNIDSTVTSLIRKEEYYELLSERFVEESFHGSLPAFLAAFSSRKKLSEQEVAELRALIDRMGEE